ncbi:hypothetical protein PQI23_05755 [Leucobacter sp. USCH14]|uniref:hypothetical protein n=1 Tax=Leucobacter sp. USCH14 TaxID=3024838 RepID=UPI0030B67CB7
MIERHDELSERQIATRLERSLQGFDYGDPQSVLGQPEPLEALGAFAAMPGDSLAPHLAVGDP